MKIFSYSILLVLFFFCFHSLYMVFSPIEVNETVIEIRPGESAHSIANKLHANQITRSAKWFYFYTKFTGNSKHLKHGKYLFHGNYGLIEVVNTIKNGKVHLQRVTIPEGLSVRKTYRILEKAGFGSAKTYKNLCTDTLFVRKLTGFPLSTLEGFLYPDTYFFPEGISEEYILRHLVDTFFKQTSDIDFKPHPILSFYEILILASIVEKEAQIESEKPTIASVYLNRIEHGGYKLQADPTVAYVLEEMGRRRKKIYYKDLEINSPYNTYIHFGLPPTPICSPSKSSILAVLEPEETDYFFFFADTKGGHIFNRTYREHVTGLQKLRGQYGN